MKSVVITGGTRGIGLGLAREFLKRGQQVTICGRSQAAVDKALAELTTDFNRSMAAGLVCDMQEPDQIQALWDATIKRFGRVDVWINNAGVSSVHVPLWEMPDGEIEKVVGTNILGVMRASQIVIQGMRRQGFGQLYNMEGMGSDGMTRSGSILYSASKACLTIFTKGLIMETQGTPVQVCYLSPGMVLTDLMIEEIGRGENRERTARVVNILADTVETVSPWLVDKVLANHKHGARIAWLTKPKALVRMASARFNKRDILSGHPEFNS